MRMQSSEPLLESPLPFKMAAYLHFVRSGCALQLLLHCSQLCLKLGLLLCCLLPGLICLRPEGLDRCFSLLSLQLRCLQDKA